MDDHEEPAPGQPTARRFWSSLWKAPAMMLFFLLAGVFFGLGHHEYYRSYNGHLVKSNSQQQWAVRIGTGLAFLTKTAFTAVVGIAFDQYIWVVVKRKPLKLRSLDAAFSLISSPTSFLDFGILSSAQLLALVAMISWLLPLIALVTPATLTVESKLTSNVTTQPVPFPNYDTTNGYNRGSNEYNVWSDYMGAGWVTQKSASPAVTRLLAAVSSGMSIAYVSAPYANSSYSIQFFGPCLKCQYLTDALNSGDYNNTALSKMWNDFTSSPVSRPGYPDSNYFYNATMIAGQQKGAPNTVEGENAILLSTNPPRGPNLTLVYTGREQITCQLRNASYNVDFTFEKSIPSITISSIVLEPVLSFGTLTQIKDLPPNGRAYLSVLMALGKQLSGPFGNWFGSNSNGLQGGDLPVMTTGLIACPEIMDQLKSYSGKKPAFGLSTAPWMCRNGSLRAAVEDLSHNFTLSLLSNAIFSTQLPVNVSSTFPMNYYVYHPKQLAVSYLTGLGVTLACFLVGGWACLSNGHSAFASFSTILQTTRNPQLDELVKSYNGGGPNESMNTLKTVKLQYGIIDSGVGHAAFGRAGTTSPITKL